MILTRTHILDRIKTGDISFSPPLDQFQLQPHAVDLRLGYRFLIPKNWMITDRGRKALTISIEADGFHAEQFDEVLLQPGQFFELLPNEFVIGTSLETIHMHAGDLMAILFPRTSTNRRGINLSLSGIIDAGYSGTLIFPMKNEAGNQVLRIYPGERVCQIVFEELSSPLTRDEANLHGLNQAKYSGNTPLFKIDKREETDLLISGNIDELKTKFSV